MWRDAIRGAQNAVFFLCSMRHWHFRAKTLCKMKLRTQKYCKTTSSWARGKNALWIRCCSERCSKVLSSIEIGPMACYRLFPLVGPWRVRGGAHPARVAGAHFC